MAQSTTDITALVSMCGTLLGGTGGSTGEWRQTASEYDARHNNRIARVLDAFASISLGNRKKGQVIAVAFHMTPTEVQLTMAGTKDIEPEVVSYIQYIWGKLREISALQFDYIGAQCNITTPISPASIIPPPPTRTNPRYYAEILDLTADLAQEVFTFCFPRLERWFNKFWPDVEDFAVDFVNNPLAKEKAGNNLVVLFDHLRTAYNLVKSVPSARTRREQRVRNAKISAVIPTIRELFRAVMKWVAGFLTPAGRRNLDKFQAVISGW